MPSVLYILQFLSIITSDIGVCTLFYLHEKKKQILNDTNDIRRTYFDWTLYKLAMGK